MKRWECKWIEWMYSKINCAWISIDVEYQQIFSVTIAKVKHGEIPGILIRIWHFEFNIAGIVNTCDLLKHCTENQRNAATIIGLQDVLQL